MAISPQRLTIYLYSAHRAVIFAIAQLSCYCLFPVKLQAAMVVVSVSSRSRRLIYIELQISNL